MSDMAPDDALLPGVHGFDPVPCPLCGSPLHLSFTSDQYLYAGFTRSDLDGIRPDDMESWDIRCERGHVVLLPPDNGEERQLFGQCHCEPGEDHPEECAAHDFDRLRKMANGE